MSFPFPISGEFFLFWTTVSWTLGAIVHIALAVAVLHDAKEMNRRNDRGTFLVGGGIWALAVLLGGVIAAGIYWLIHHSTLRPERLSKLEDEPPLPEPPPAPRSPAPRPPGADY